MHLKYIEIQGFKSFPDKTRLGFDRCLTGIVGPNGSGKSNISDAVRWVLGEQSTKSLRGGKMEDVIFGGTQLRKAMGFAQVSMCLDNSDGRIKDAGPEIVVTRRYYRSGDSEYLINGGGVRLRDVREMFMDTGLGRDGYSIVGQGRIAEIVNAKSDERRELFEEAAGIAKYRFRKNEAGRKLDAANDNLERLQDILDELESRLGPLEEQSIKAKKFLELSEERRSLEITLYCDTIDRAKENLRAQDDKIVIAQQDYEKLNAELSVLDETVNAAYTENNRLATDIDASNARRAEIAGDIAAIESEIAVVRNDIAHGEEQVKTLEADLELLSGDGSGIAKSIEERLMQAEEKRQEIARLDILVEQAQAALDALLADSALSDQKREELLRRLADAQSRMTDLRVAEAQARSAIESMEERREKLSAQTEELTERLDSLRAEKRENDAFYEKLSADIAERSNRISGFNMKLQSRAEKRDELRAKLDKKAFEIGELQHKMAALEEMDRSMEGFLPSVKRVAEAARERRLRGVVGTVASLISIKSGCELAIETALGAAMQNIVVEDEASAKQAIAFLKETKAGRATFLPLDTIKPSHFDGTDVLREEGVVGLASDLVSADGRYSAIVSSLLGRIVVADDLNTASVAAKKLRYRYRIVTMDGQVINAGGSYTGGFSSRGAGVFSRKNEIEKLRVRVEELEKARAAQQEEFEALQQEVTRLEAEITAIGSDLVTYNEDKIRVETALAQQKRDISAAHDALGACEDELERIELSVAQKTKDIADGEAAAADLAKELEILEAAQDTAGGDDISRKQAELSARLSEHRIARVERQKDMEALEHAVEQLRMQDTLAADRAANLRAAIEGVHARNAERLAVIEEKQQRIGELQALSEGCTADIEAAVARRTENERRITEMRESYSGRVNDRENVGREMARLEERKVALQTEYDRFVARLWEEYELTKNEADGLCVPFESISELRSAVASIRGKIKGLGHVNVGAIDEFKEVSERHGFLKGQVEDVEKSRSELLKLIAGLEGEMRTIFTDKFNRISSRFRTVFVELFGGGSANLSLEDENDVLESGILLDVQPPGKVIKNLAQLSGGEQALVAIAIYFSILSVNPSPFCILDEIDSALDESNVVRFASYIKNVIDQTQIITITHRRGTMEAADVLYGVTMQEEGVSKVLKLGIEEAQLVVSN